MLALGFIVAPTFPSHTAAARRSRKPRLPHIRKRLLSYPCIIDRKLNGCPVLELDFLAIRDFSSNSAVPRSRKPIFCKYLLPMPSILNRNANVYTLERV